jgi:hypothetical protein
MEAIAMKRPFRRALKRPFRRAFIGALASAALLASLLPAVASADGGATRLAYVPQPSNALAGGTIGTFAVHVQDSTGLDVTTGTTAVTIAIGANPSLGTLTGTLTRNTVLGVATFNDLSINNAGAGYTLQATDGALTATSSSFTIFRPATQLVFGTQPSATAAGATISPPVSILVEDSLGNVVTSSSATVSVAIQSNPASGTLGGTTSVNAVNGVATFNNLSINNAGANYTLVASSSGLASTAPSVAFNIGGTANHLVFVTQPGGGAAGAIWTQQPVVAVENASNAVVSDGSTVYLSISTNPAGGTLSCTGGVSEVAVNGYAYFSGCSINLGSASAYTLTATSSAGWTPAVSGAFYIGGTANQLVFVTQPGGGAAGAVWSIQPVVAVENASNAVVSDNSTVYLSISTNPAGGTLSCTGGVSEVAVNGYAYFSGCSINLGSASAYTLTATSSLSWTPATSSAFYVGGSSQQLVFVTQPGGGAAGAVWSIQPVVAVENASNSVVSDYSTVVYLSIATNPAGGTLSCTGGTSEVAVNGYAYFTGCSINLGSAGAYTLYATSNPSWTAATSSGFYVSSTQAAVTISSDTAVGQVTSGFSRATKIVRPGTWITVRFQTSPTLAGRTLGIWIAKKTNGVWGAFSPHASITTNSSGVAYYQYRTTSTVWQSFLVKFAGDSTAGPSSSSGTQVRWL